ncbi:MAG: DUF2029 domain-containing protein, partial [Phycisphaerae bacterium]|nr:DUF2029 domain-containing protein [Phycisphaerae bacterium]
IWAGVFVGLAAIAKITPAALVLAFILRRDWKATLASGLTVLALMGTSYAALGDTVFSQWQANLKQQPDNLGSMISAENMSLHGYILRALVQNPDDNAALQPWTDVGRATAGRIRWTFALALWAGTSAWLLYRRRELSTAESLAALVPVVLLTSPITWTHHGVLALVPLAATLPVLLRQRNARVIDLAWFGLAALLLTVWPVQQFDLQLPSWLTLLATPTLTYALLLLWLFIVLRFARLKQALHDQRRTIFSKPPATAHLGGPVFSAVTP